LAQQNRGDNKDEFLLIEVLLAVATGAVMTATVSRGLIVQTGQTVGHNAAALLVVHPNGGCFTQARPKGGTAGLRQIQAAEYCRLAGCRRKTADLVHVPGPEGVAVVVPR
jgi:hypothetical protein